MLRRKHQVYFMKTIFWFFVLIFIASSVCDAQRSSWLQRSWRGRAYTLGNDPKNYELVLTITKIKGKNFEGVMTTSQPADPSVHFDTKISGTVEDDHLQISMPGWKVKCGNCAPQTLGFSMESGKFFMKGEAKGCYIECTWITVFSEDLMKFNTSDQQYLLAVSDREGEPDTTSVAQNTPPSKDTAVITPKEDPLPKRIPLIAAGDVAFATHKSSQLLEKPGSLKSAPSLVLKETMPEIRISVLPAGEIVSFPHSNNVTYSGKKEPLKDPSLQIKENVPEIRTPVLPAGEIVAFEHHNDVAYSGKKEPLKNPSLEIKENVQEIRTSIIPAGEIILLPAKDLFAASQNVHVTMNKNISMGTQKYIAPPKIDSQKQVVAKKDSVSLLPQDYSERKKNVIRTLIVNTDSIVLRVYDNGVVDGDIVSVIYNDKVVIDKLSLTSHAVVVKVPVTKEGINTLVFHAHNLGEYPPNTAELEILYGNKKEELTVSSDLTVSSMIDVKYQK
jgi:hypothetical protein